MSRLLFFSFESSYPGTVPVPAGAMQHVSLALSRLLEQWKGKPNIAALLSSLAGASQPIENALQQLLTQRFVTTAVGAQLDVLGSLVGQPRNGLADADYARYIQARISTNRSSGTLEDLITIARLVLVGMTPAIVAKREGTATVVVRIPVGPIPLALGTILSSFLNDAVAGGVRLLTEASASAPTATFTLDKGPGLDVGHLAYAL